MSDRCPTTGMPLIWGPTLLADISMARAQAGATAIYDEYERAGWRAVAAGFERIYELRTQAIATGAVRWWESA